MAATVVAIAIRCLQELDDGHRRGGRALPKLLVPLCPLLPLLARILGEPALEKELLLADEV